MGIKVAGAKTVLADLSTLINQTVAVSNSYLFVTVTLPTDIVDNSAQPYVFIHLSGLYSTKADWQNITTVTMGLLTFYRYSISATETVWAVSYSDFCEYCNSQSSFFSGTITIGASETMRGTLTITGSGYCYTQPVMDISHIQVGLHPIAQVWRGERNNTKRLIWQNLPPYVDDPYILLDGIKNTRSGHSSSTTVWEDLSGNRNDFTIDGTTVWGDSYIESNTTNHPMIYIDQDLTTSDGTNGAFTVEFVTKITNGTGNYEGYLDTNKDSAYRQVFGAGGRYALRYGSGSDNYKSVGQSSGLLANQLMTLGFTYNGSTSYAYINGVRKTSTSGAIPRMSGLTRTYIFSDKNNVSSYNARGYAYGFRFYKKALTDAEMLNNYNVDLRRYAGV